jgi:formamidopyrimidine-DNA glycosylase
MFEIAECVTLAEQMSRRLSGKRIVSGSLGNSPHKFVWYNVKPKEFAAAVVSRTVGAAYARGRWIFVPLNEGYVLVLGECGGRILLHESASRLPTKYHLSLLFEDGSALSATTQMWGAMELYEKGKELERKYIHDMRTTPIEKGFDLRYFSALVTEAVAAGNRTVKALLTQEQMIPGLGNAIAQDIMFGAGLHPKQPLEQLDAKRIAKLHRAITDTVREAIRLGGRNDECDLYGRAGRYVRIMDKNAVGHPCPKCGARVEKTAYLGGACYFCPKCQALM